MLRIIGRIVGVSHTYTSTILEVDVGGHKPITVKLYSTAYRHVLNEPNGEVVWNPYDSWATGEAIVRDLSGFNFDVGDEVEVIIIKTHGEELEENMRKLLDSLYRDRFQD